MHVSLCAAGAHVCLRSVFYQCVRDTSDGMIRSGNLGGERGRGGEERGEEMR